MNLARLGDILDRADQLLSTLPQEKDPKKREEGSEELKQKSEQIFDTFEKHIQYQNPENFSSDSKRRIFVTQDKCACLYKAEHPNYKMRRLLKAYNIITFEERHASASEKYLRGTRKWEGAKSELKVKSILDRLENFLCKFQGISELNSHEQKKIKQGKNTVGIDIGKLDVDTFPLDELKKVQVAYDRLAARVEAQRPRYGKKKVEFFADSFPLYQLRLNDDLQKNASSSSSSDSSSSSGDNIPKQGLEDIHLEPSNETTSRPSIFSGLATLTSLVAQGFQAITGFRPIGNEEDSSTQDLDLSPSASCSSIDPFRSIPTSSSSASHSPDDDGLRAAASSNSPTDKIHSKRKKRRWQDLEEAIVDESNATRQSQRAKKLSRKMKEILEATEDLEDSAPVNEPSLKKRQISSLEKLINSFPDKKYCGQLRSNKKLVAVIKKENPVILKNAKEIRLFGEYQKELRKGNDPMSGKISIITHPVIGRYAVALEPIKKGTVLGEYVGQLVPRDDESYKGSGQYRILVDLGKEDYEPWCIDGEEICNHTAFFAHNKEDSEDLYARPNAFCTSIIDNKWNYHIVFFASKKIPAGYPISFDYSDRGHFESLGVKFNPIGLEFHLNQTQLKEAQEAALNAQLYLVSPKPD